MMYETVGILGVQIHKITETQLDKEIVSKLMSNNRKEPTLFIATVNPSFLVKAYRNKKFANLLNNTTTINVSDGYGIQMMSGGELKVIKGVDIVKSTLEDCQRLHKSLLVVHKVGALITKGELEKYIYANYPNVSYKVVEYHPSVPINGHFDVVMCTLGEVVQEEILAFLIPRIKPSVAIGVGGSFDLLTNRIKVLPIVKKHPGIEWIYRLARNPKRFPKVVRSVVIFPILVLVGMLLNQDRPVSGRSRMKTP